MDYTDGVRILFANGEVAHVRPSGNADELRIYAVADTQRRADGSPPWELRSLRVSCARWRRPSMLEAGVLTLQGVVQHYDWGGYHFIPELLGVENPTRRPFSELWIGAHAKAPSLADVGGAQSRSTS